MKLYKKGDRFIINPTANNNCIVCYLEKVHKGEKNNYFFAKDQLDKVCEEHKKIIKIIE